MKITSHNGKNGGVILPKDLASILVKENEHCFDPSYRKVKTLIITTRPEED